MQKTSAKQQELEQMRFNMYKKMFKADKIYKHLPLEQKLEYVQSAFNDVSSYCCKLWGLPKGIMSLGFCVGVKCTAQVQKANSAVIYSIAAIAQNNSQNPAFQVYKVLFHEMAHMKQYSKITPGRIAQGLFPFGRSPEGTESHIQWLAKPAEIEADLVADLQILKIAQEGLIKSSSKVEPANIVKNSKITLLKNLGKHSLGSLLVGGECALRLFGRKPNATVGQIVNGGLRIFNLKEAQEVLVYQPVGHDNEFLADYGEALREYSYEHGDKAHQMERFFDLNRSLNNLQSAEVLRNSSFIKTLEDNNFNGQQLELEDIILSALEEDFQPQFEEAQTLPTQSQNIESIPLPNQNSNLAMLYAHTPPESETPYTADNAPIIETPNI